MFLATIRKAGVPTVVHGQAARVAGAKVTEERNAIPSFEFTMYPGMPGYDELTEFATTVDVVRLSDGATVFDGRVISAPATMDTDGSVCKSVICEGVEGYLCDSRQPYTEERLWEGDAKQTGLEKFLAYLLANHNARVPAEKRVYPGTVDVATYKTTENVMKGTNFERTWDAIQEKLVKVFGGELRMRRGDDGVLRLDYMEVAGKVCKTPIRVGRNMESATREVNPDQLVTRLYPRGAKLSRTVTDDNGTEREEETDERLSIASVNNGREYIDDEEAMRVYGVIEGTHEWDDVTEAVNLMSKGTEWLRDNNALPVATEVSALDLSLIGIDPDGIELLNWYPVSNPLIGLNETLEVVKHVIDVNDPSASTFELGETTQTQSERIASLGGLKGDVEYVKSQSKSNVVNIANSVRYTMAALEVAEERIKSTVGEQIVQTTEGLNGQITVLKSRVSEIEQTATEIKLSVTELTESQETLRAKVDLMPDQITSTVTKGYEDYVNGKMEVVDKSFSAIQQTFNKINLSISNLYDDQDVLRSAIKLMPDQITSTVTKGYEEYVDGKVTTINSSISSIQQTANSLTTTVASLQALWGTCSTASATAAKAVTVSGFQLRTGAVVNVRFTYGNTAASPTLNVSGTGAKAIVARNTSQAVSWAAGDVLSLVYSGAYWYVADCGSMSSISQLSSSITLKVSKGDVSSQLSLETGKVSITSNRFSWTSRYSSMTTYGELTCTSGKIGGFTITSYSIYNGKVTLDSGGLTLYHEPSSGTKELMGGIGTNKWVGNANINGLTFDLEPLGDFMAWASRMNSSDSSYTWRVIYTRTAFSSYSADTFNVSCKMHVWAESYWHNYTAHNFWIDPSTGGVDGGMSIGGTVRLRDPNNNYWDVRVKNGVIVSA